MTNVDQHRKNLEIYITDVLTLFELRLQEGKNCEDQVNELLDFLGFKKDWIKEYLITFGVMRQSSSNVVDSPLPKQIDEPVHKLEEQRPVEECKTFLLKLLTSN